MSDPRQHLECPYSLRTASAGEKFVKHPDHTDLIRDHRKADRRLDDNQRSGDYYCYACQTDLNQGTCPHCNGKAHLKTIEFENRRESDRRQP